jgi:hypothetical protein
MKPTAFGLALASTVLALRPCLAADPPAAPPPPAPPPALRPAELPVRALMMFFPSPATLDQFLAFVREDLPREGVNHLILEIDYDYQYQSRPEMAGSIPEASVKAVAAACRAAGVKVIPLVNCLGHQSWAEKTHRLLTAHPEFDETPERHPDNKDIYCRSYCPNHPAVHAVVFALLAEIAAAFETDAVHVGMDEVFLIGEEACPRCHGADRAELFAQEVRTLHDFLRSRGIRMWLWGDRLLDGRTTGLGPWEASMNGTHRAIDLVPRDIVICDWHYEAAPPTAAYFAMKGFDVVMCSWNRPAVAETQADQVVALRTANAQNLIGPRLRGVMATNWEAQDKFVASYRAAKSAHTAADLASAENFIRLMARVRTLQPPAAPATPPMP